MTISEMVDQLIEEARSVEYCQITLDTTDGYVSLNQKELEKARKQLAETREKLIQMFEEGK